MNKNLILTSILSIAVAGPALAETFPNDGEMQPNTTYENAATYTNMGVYSGTATAEPQYDINSYNITAGQYLAANGITGTTCPAGSYCIGGNFTFSETNTQGLASCPATYSLSAEGAKTEAECYRQCTASDVAHSKATGTFTGMFYSNNTNACEPVNNASCADGYHYKEGSVGVSPAICEANDITIDWGNGSPTTCKYDGDITTPVNGVEKTGYTFKGWKFNKNK